MRIGECADLSVDCLRPLGQDHWAIHVPLGKLKTERWVPVDSFVCHVVNRLRLLRSLHAPQADGFLLARPRGRYTLIRGLRAVLRDVAASAGITTRVVPHQFRHTYGTEMLRRRQLCGRHEVARPQVPRHDLAISGSHPSETSSASITWPDLTPDTLLHRHGRCSLPPRLVLTWPACSTFYKRPSTFSRCSAVSFPRG